MKPLAGGDNSHNKSQVFPGPQQINSLLFPQLRCQWEVLVGAYVSKSDEYTENEQATGLGRKPELIVVRR